jgi:hypothetical protein
MSRIGSSSGASGVRVAATQLSNVYTVLLLVAALAMIVSVVFACLALQNRYGSILTVGAAGERTENELKAANDGVAATSVKLEQGRKALELFMGGAGRGGAAVPTPGATEKPPAEPPATPATPAAPAAGEKPATGTPAGEKPAAAPPAEKTETPAPAAAAPAAK